jgi:hypothetical protein
MRRIRFISVAAFLALFLAAVGAQAADNLVDLRLCPVLDLSAADAAATLPTSLLNVSSGSTFFLEIWTKDLSSPSRGISGGFLNLMYSTDALDATSLSHGSTYNILVSGAITDPAGLVADFGGNSMSGTPGKTEWARLGWITFNATTSGTATFTAQGASSGDGFARLQEDLPGGMVPWSQINAPSASVTVVPEPGCFVMLAAASLALASFAFLKRPSSRMT